MECGVRRLPLDMTDETNSSAQGTAVWQPWQVYVMAGICLLAGVLVGYLARGSAAATASPENAAASNEAPAQGQMPPAAQMQQMPSLDDMKRMADKQVEPLLTKLKSDPNNADLLNQVGNVYRVTHQFKTAASYYEKVLAVNPKNVGARTDLASCMYYDGDVDGAIAQLEKSLSYDPKHAGTLLNLGLIRWKGKGDAAGAVSSWEKLLKLNPNYENKDAVQKLIAEAKTHTGKQLPQSE